MKVTWYALRSRATEKRRRDAEAPGECEDAHQIDVALTYAIPLIRRVEPWIRMDVCNLFDAGALVGFNTTVTADSNGPKDELGLPTSYVEGALFGRPTSVATLDNPGHGQLPREIRSSAEIGF